MISDRIKLKLNKNESPLTLDLTHPSIIDANGDAIVLRRDGHPLIETCWPFAVPSI